MVGAIEERGRLPVLPGWQSACRLSDPEGKVGQLVVEQEAICHQPGAETVFDGRGHGDSVPSASTIEKWWWRAVPVIHRRRGGDGFHPIQVRLVPHWSTRSFPFSNAERVLR